MKNQLKKIFSNFAIFYSILISNLLNSSTYADTDKVKIENKNDYFVSTSSMTEMSNLDSCYWPILNLLIRFETINRNLVTDVTIDEKKVNKTCMKFMLYWSRRRAGKFGHIMPIMKLKLVKTWEYVR